MSGIEFLAGILVGLLRGTRDCHGRRMVKVIKRAPLVRGQRLADVANIGPRALRLARPE